MSIETDREFEIRHLLENRVIEKEVAATLKQALEKMVRSGADLSGAYLSGAYLSGAYLSGAYLSGADLSGADLSGADLSGADLSGADLSGADLSGAYLSGAYLSGADLSGADLSGADLRGAYLRGAYLRGADLSGADLSGADLSGADLSGARHSKTTLWPAPTVLLLASWGKVSDELCKALMRFDAANHPKPEIFNAWAVGGSCPYANITFERCARFQENSRLWTPDLLTEPVKSALELAQMLIKEKLEYMTDKDQAEAFKKEQAEVISD